MVTTLDSDLNLLSLYTDRYGRIHDKQCKDGEPSSNNGWLYSAVAVKLGVILNIDQAYARSCAYDRVRHLNDYEPPISRDEILGLSYLGFSTELKLDNWNFSPYPLPPLNIIELVKQLTSLYGEHRNYFWQNKLTQVYHVAFMVPFHDRNFILECQGKSSIPYCVIAKLSQIGKPTDKSSRLIRFLKTGEDKEAVRNYFGSEHPLCLYI